MMERWLKKLADCVDAFGAPFEKYFIGFFTAYGWQGFLLRITVATAFYIVLDDSMGAAKGYVVVAFLVSYSFAKLAFDYSKHGKKRK